MSETDDKIKIELNNRKEVLNQHLDKFNQLKSEGRWSEAWNQLLTILNYANETLKYSAALLKNINHKIPKTDPIKVAVITKKPEDEISKTNPKKPCDHSGSKMVVVPKQQNVH